MDSDPRLIERAAENKAQSENQCNIPSDNELVVNFELDIGSKNQINFKNLEGEKQKLCDIEDLTDIDDISEYFSEYNITFSDKVEDELQLLKTKIQKARDTDIDMYQLSYRVNSDGSSEFYIPMSTEFTDDFIVTKIYNSEGTFVAEDIEQNISYPIYEIESKKYYINEISNEDNIVVFSKKRQEFSDYMNDLYKTQYADRVRDTKYSALFTALIYLPTAYFYLVSAVDLAKFMLFICTLFFFFSIIMPIGMIVGVSKHIVGYIKYKRTKYYDSEREFQIDKQ